MSDAYGGLCYVEPEKLYGRIHQKYLGSLVTAELLGTLPLSSLPSLFSVSPFLLILPSPLPLAAQALSTLTVLTSSVLPFHPGVAIIVDFIRSLEEPVHPFVPCSFVSFSVILLGALSTTCYRPMHP